MGKFLFPLGLQFGVVLVVTLVGISAAQVLSRSLGPEDGEGSKSEDGNFSMRKSRIFPYFLIQFPNEPCSTSTGSGVCVSAKDCRQSGGVSVGVCAQGFGACCRFTRTCGNGIGTIEIRENSTDLTRSNRSCSFALPRGRGICQVKLDFNQFMYGKGLSSGNCSNTKITISGAANLNKDIDLCGNLTRQHLLLTYGAAEKLLIRATEPEFKNETFSIRVSYIRCDSRQLAPSYCAQYYTGREGEVRSLNYPKQQLNNQDYTVCVADPRNSISGRNFRQISIAPVKIQWSTCENNAFFISGKINDPEVADPNNCKTDFIQFFGGNRQCGNKFTAETVSAPYLLRVKFDELEKTIEPKEQMLINLPSSETCDVLSTPEVKCKNATTTGMCRCLHVIQIKNEDEGNTGFCLNYKIIE